MVDVGGKPRTRRVAVAEGTVRLRPETLARIVAGRVEKGDVLAAARLAGVMAVKRTPDLVPLCHPIAITSATVEVEPDPGGAALRVRSRVETRDRTGVEMEALTAVTAACLTVYDMCKALDPAMTIERVALREKSGGKSGAWKRPAGGDGAPKRRGSRSAG